MAVPGSTEKAVIESSEEIPEAPNKELEHVSEEIPTDSVSNDQMDERTSLHQSGDTSSVREDLDMDVVNLAKDDDDECSSQPHIPKKDQVVKQNPVIIISKATDTDTLPGSSNSDKMKSQLVHLKVPPVEYGIITEECETSSKEDEALNEGLVSTFPEWQQSCNMASSEDMSRIFLEETMSCNLKRDVGSLLKMVRNLNSGAGSAYSNESLKPSSQASSHFNTPEESWTQELPFMRQSSDSESPEEDITKSVRSDELEDSSTTESDSLSLRNKETKMRGKYTTCTIPKKRKSTIQSGKRDEGAQAKLAPLRTSVPTKATQVIDMPCKAASTTQTKTTAKKEISPKSPMTQRGAPVLQTEMRALTRAKLQSQSPSISSKRRSSTTELPEKQTYHGTRAIKTPMKDNTRTDRILALDESPQSSCRRTTGLSAIPSRLTVRRSSESVTIKPPSALRQCTKQTGSTCRDPLISAPARVPATKPTRRHSSPAKYPNVEKKSPQETDKKESGQPTTRIKIPGNTDGGTSPSSETQKAETEQENTTSSETSRSNRPLSYFEQRERMEDVIGYFPIQPREPLNLEDLDTSSPETSTTSPSGLKRDKSSSDDSPRF